MGVLRSIVDKHGLALAASAALMTLVAPATASAAVHTGRIVYEEPQNPRSIGEPKPPADQLSEHPHEILVTYDATAGSLTLQLEAWNPAYWGERWLDNGSLNVGTIQAEPFSVGPRCDEEVGAIGGTSATLAGLIEARPYVAPHPVYEGSPTPLSEAEGGVTGAVALHGYAGTVQGRGSFNGQRFVIAFSDPAFTNQDWRCVSLGSEVGFNLGGWPAPPAVVAHRASTALIRTLASTANAHHTDGFDVRHQYLTNARVTNNGWADAEQRFRRPSAPWQRQRGIFIVFRDVGVHWRVATYGSALSTGLCHAGKKPAIPAAVCHALRL